MIIKKFKSCIIWARAHDLHSDIAAVITNGKFIYIYFIYSRWKRSFIPLFFLFNVNIYICICIWNIYLPRCSCNKIRKWRRKKDRTVWTLPSLSLFFFFLNVIITNVSNLWTFFFWDNAARRQFIEFKKQLIYFLYFFCR